MLLFTSTCKRLRLSIYGRPMLHNCTVTPFSSLIIFVKLKDMEMELDGLFAYYSKLSSIHYLVTLSYKRLNAQASISTRLLILQILECCTPRRGTVTFCGRCIQATISLIPGIQIFA